MPFDTQDGVAPSLQAYVCSDTGAATARAVLAESKQAAKAIHGGGLSGQRGFCPTRRGSSASWPRWASFPSTWRQNASRN